MLEAGKDPEQALKFLANTLTNKLLHTPSQSVARGRQRAGQHELLEAADTLFQLSDRKKNS